MSCQLFCCLSPEECDILSDDVSSSFPPSERFENLMGRLGLSDRKPVPDPVNWDEQDPLGSKTISNVFSQTDPLAPISENLCRLFIFLLILLVLYVVLIFISSLV